MTGTTIISQAWSTVRGLLAKTRDPHENTRVCASCERGNARWLA